jgi:hypothetical protein
LPTPGCRAPERRSALAAEGAKLLPNSGVACPGPLAYGACSNGYREAVVWTDVEMPDGRRRVEGARRNCTVATAWGLSAAVNDDDDGAPASQSHVALAADGLRRLRRLAGHAQRRPTTSTPRAAPTAARAGAAISR